MKMTIDEIRKIVEDFESKLKDEKLTRMKLDFESGETLEIINEEI